MQLAISLDRDVIKRILMNDITDLAVDWTHAEWNANWEKVSCSVFFFRDLLVTAKEMVLAPVPEVAKEGGK